MAHPLPVRWPQFSYPTVFVRKDSEFHQRTMNTLWRSITACTELRVAECAQPHVILTVLMMMVTITDRENGLCFMSSYLDFTVR